MQVQIQRFIAAAAAACAAFILLLTTAAPAAASGDEAALGPTNPGCVATTSATACAWSDETTNYTALEKYCSQPDQGCYTCVQQPSEYCNGTGGYDRAF